MGQLGVLYHTQDGSFIQPVLGGKNYVVEYTTGQLYGFCDDDAIATPAELAVRGLAFKLLPVDYDPAKYQWNPATKQMEVIPPKPTAAIVTKIAGVPATVFTESDAIEIEVTIKKLDGQVETAFSGPFVVPFFGDNGKAIHVKMTFNNGIATKTIPAGKLTAGTYRATKASSSLVDVTPHEIIVAL